MTNKAYSEDSVEQAKLILRELLDFLRPKFGESGFAPGWISVALAVAAIHVENAAAHGQIDALDVRRHSEWFGELMRAAATGGLSDPLAACDAAGRWAYAYNNQEGFDLTEEMREAQFKAELEAGKAQDST